MMERLREAIEHCYEVAKDQCGNRCANEHIQLAKWLEDLQDFYALKEQGKLLKLPCKPGDTVYELCKFDDGIYRIFSMQIKTVVAYGTPRLDKKGVPTVWNIYAESDYTYMYKSFYDIGKTVFLTEQEALEALEGMKKRK